eukprot:CAMPEP_0195013624 /NCGR_PEP_ID=MMETSP0326_2-20130528/13863_1 /TAXON_ID=2866 ORGANISM="Crypthecodinium cohnii, Strain Seligo" /NCGR_SAMPLE_ID=MMETSP0326_2 /ASSEMBLY_ACC=CAM_ASM_000348 /LENGTH=60 /DNA_ID=CAMNT_0040024421 /DNA_START=146 /DNA_END=328 /DNA_ORIENTATION=-
MKLESGERQIAKVSERTRATRNKCDLGHDDEQQQENVDDGVAGIVGTVVDGFAKLGWRGG